MKYIILMALLLTGCSSPMAVQGIPIPYVCKINNIKGFPQKINGYLAVELRTTVTIFITNSDKTQRVDLTFKKEHCKAGR